MITSLVKTLLGITPKDQPDTMIKAWIEFSVDTYWTTHGIIAGRSLTSMAAKWQSEHRGVTLDCIGRYTGPKTPGEPLSDADIQHMEGYRGSPGRVLYFNGAKPVHA